MGVPQAVTDTLSTDERPLEDVWRPPVVLQVLARLEAAGAERDAVEIAGAILAAGGIAVVASAGGRMVRALDRLGAQHVTLPLDSRNPFVIRANANRLVQLVQRHRVDILHACGRAPIRSARLAAQRTGCPFVTTFQTTFRGAGRGAGDWAARWLRHRCDSVTATGDRVIAVSDFIADHVRARYAVDSDRLRVIHRGVDLRRFDPDQVRPHRLIELARQWRLPDGVPLIMLPGQLTRATRQRVLIEALARLRHRELLCLIVGSDDGHGSAFRRAIEGQIDGHGLKGRVQIVGACADMPAAYMLADVVVSSPDIPKPFGRAIAEARAMGRPVVAGDHGGAREQLAGSPMAWLIPPGDPAALAEAIEAALDLTSEERARFAPEAAAAVRSHFSNGEMCARTLSVYAELLGAERHAASA